MSERGEPGKVDDDLPMVYRQGTVKLRVSTDENPYSRHKLLITEHKDSILDCIDPLFGGFHVSVEEEFPEIRDPSDNDLVDRASRLLAIEEVVNNERDERYVGRCHKSKPGLHVGSVQPLLFQRGKRNHSLQYRQCLDLLAGRPTLGGG